MTKEESMDVFSTKMAQTFGDKYDLRWETDKKGLVCGWCKLVDLEGIYAVAELVAGLQGRVMTISPLNRTGGEQPEVVDVNYHFYFGGVNLTVCITLPDDRRTVRSITPVLKSADWHEREMQELFNIRLQGHPNPRRLFLDPGIHMTDHTMIPLSEAMKGTSTSTLWERIMQSGQKGDK